MVLGYKIWIDIKNSHEPLLFKSLIKDLPYEFYITARDYAEVIGLLEKYKLSYKKIGKYHAKNKVTKFLYLGIRTLHLTLVVPNFDYFLSHGSIYGILASRLKKKKSITIFDGDISNRILENIFKYSSYLVLTSYTNYKKFKVPEKKVRTFEGFKEDIYLAELEPEKCPDEIPFEKFSYVIIRPEAYGAYYISLERSIVPELINLFSKENINIVLLPRYPEEREKYKEFSKVYIPSTPINGICGAYFARAVLTGSGTLGREAACMGTTAVSFYPGEEYLSVDKELINRGWLYHSRDPKEIVKYVMNNFSTSRNLERSKRVKREVIKILREIIEG